MSIVGIDSRWSDLLPMEWIRRLDDTPFLTRCREGRATREELLSFVRQQSYYSRHFTRFLTALMSNLEDEADRHALTQNLWEEMGLGQAKAVPHSQIYRDMMSQMNVRCEDEPQAPETRALINVMLECCRSAHPMIGLGAICLGAEAIVPHIYSTIVEGFYAIGEPRAHLEFFLIHMACDDDHAITMRNIIMKLLKTDRRDRVELDYGAAKALSARVEFFNAITPYQRVAA